ncbi:unnamed protein product [Thlaspi arvense]|uniref:Uncharacterized protein n=1 Tax=Thlaspi arvense TaxID=13288 RepID=A0AAU9RXL2_THLAR|nr:unnamed protein product [Thlaspi arvense]
MKAFLAKGRLPRVRVSVEGYDTLVPQEDIKKALTNHFSSCGEVLTTKKLVRRAFVVLRGDGVEGKALQLDGSDVGGWEALVKVTPTEDEVTLRYKARLLKETCEDKRCRFGITVRGYDTSLPDVKTTLVKHFSSCGKITHVYISTLDRKTNIYFSRRDEEKKALKLDGSEVGGWKLAVTLVATTRGNPDRVSKKRRLSYCIPGTVHE